MSGYFARTAPRMAYVDRHELLRSQLTEEAFRARRQVQLDMSTTVYVGNLSFYTTEQQLYGHFASCGHIRDMVMGLRGSDRTPCGFCFIVYETRAAAEKAAGALDGSLLDDRQVRVGWDVGCDARRRWGRGAHGGQVVDRLRQTLDEGRGGLGGLRRDAAGVGSVVEEEALTVYEWVLPPFSKGSASTRQEQVRASQRKREHDGDWAHSGDAPQGGRRRM